MGGWGNTRTQLEVKHEGTHGPLGQSADFTVEAGRWYDLRLEVQRAPRQLLRRRPPRQRGRPSGPSGSPTPLFASATYDTAAGDVIVKVVNVGRTNPSTPPST